MVGIPIEKRNFIVDTKLQSNQYYHTNNNNDHRTSKSYINYKQIYGIRYDPNQLKNYFKNQELLPESTFVNSNDNVTIKNLMDNINIDNTMVADEEIATISTDVINDTDSEYLHNQSNYNRNTTLLRATTTTTTNIMKPSRLRIALEYLSNRIKQLFRNGIPSTLNSIQINNNPIDNGQRFLNIFNIVKFENIPCTTTQHLLTPLKGVCYHKHECDRFGGIAVNECASGFGVCCIFQVECNGITNQNITYFQNPGFPTPSTNRLICVLTIELVQDVKQILLEFIKFEINPPILGTCSDDQFIVSGNNKNNIIPIICGINTGQHMYIEVEDSFEGKVFLSLLTRSFDSRMFNIRVTQLTKDLAPQNCLQYFDGITGYIETFNYRDESEIIEKKEPSYFNNLNYAICIKRESGYCEISYTNEYDDVEHQFQLINVDEDGNSILPSLQAGAEIYDCVDDFIAINGIRLCGEKLNDARITNDFTLNAMIRDTSYGPIILPVRTNNDFVARGFKLFYEQIECNS